MEKKIQSSLRKNLFLPISRFYIAESPSVGSFHLSKKITTEPVGIHVSCSAEDHSQFGMLNLSSLIIAGLLYIVIAGHLPRLESIKQPSHNIYHTF